MPALKLLSCSSKEDGRKRNLTTRPFAGDDLQILCVLHGVYRLVQLICIIPCWIWLFLFRLDGGVDLNGKPTWCEDSLEADSMEEYDPLSELEYDDEILQNIDDYETVILSVTIFLLLSILYTFLDLILSLSVWSACSVGTPTDPKGRDTIMTSLVWIKVAFINLLLMCVFVAGVLFVVYGRLHNYGCGVENDEATALFETSTFYTMFCICMVTYLGELLLWPCIVFNQVAQALLQESRERSVINFWYFVSRSPHTLKKEYEHQYRQTAIGIGDCLKCLQIMSCNKLAPAKIRSEVDLSDAAISLMDFFNVETNFDIVLSDVYVTFKILNRLRKTKAFEASHHSQLDRARQRASIDSSKILQHDNENDMNCIREAATYAPYALGIYENYQQALMMTARFTSRTPEVFHPCIVDRDGGSFNLGRSFPLTEFEQPNTHIVYGSFINERVGELIATPYCILVDNDAKKIVIAVRGSASLEDLVTDLQLSPAGMEDVGKVCGFDGKNKYAHRGILIRAKWILNDIKKKRVLRSILPPESLQHKHHELSGYSLVVTGHSLGAACASMLATMLKPIYNDVKCYAYCPPGCTSSLEYAEECREYVVSVVCGNDLIPRVNLITFEIMRYEFFETLARIKCSKLNCILDLRKPHKDISVPEQMKKLLHDKDSIPSHTEYYRQLQAFKVKREKEVKERFPPETRLTIPGRIIHLKHCLDEDGNLAKKYAPHWESNDFFSELTLNLQAVREHSIDNLVEHLSKIAAAYEDVYNGNKMISDFPIHDRESLRDAYMSTRQQEHDEGDTFDYQGFFVLCSRPHGFSTLFPTVLAIAAIIVSISGNNVCNILVRKVVGDLYFNATNGSREKITAVSFGLYSWGFEYYHEGNDDLIRQCSLQSPQKRSDIYIKVARGSATVAVFIGLFSFSVLSIANCMHLKEETFRRLSFGLLVATCCEALIFMLMMSVACHVNPDNLPPEVILEGCKLNTGSTLTISAVILWFASSVLTGLICHLSSNKRFPTIAQTTTSA